MLKVTVTSPEQCFLDTDATHVSLPGTSGGFEIHANHAPLISLLSTGVLTVHLKDKEPFVLFVDGGIVEVSNNAISILIDSAHHARIAEEEKLLAEQRQHRRDLQNQDKINYHALLGQLSKLAAELQAIDKQRKYRNQH
jgi:F-type H+-transporting ATPase subunit epsilon